MSESLSTFRILLEGIRASGRHGANPDERDLAQEFVVDLEVVVEVSYDELAETADYAAIAAEVRRVVETESFELLESLAAAVAGAVFELDDAVMEVVATVHKPAAAEMLSVDDVAVTAVFPPGSFDAL